MKAIEVNINREDQELMEKLVGAGEIQHKVARRLQTVLLRVQGKETKSIASHLGISAATVTNAVNQYNREGVESLVKNKSRKPGTPPISIEQKQELYRIACTETPPDQTHWSCRTLAARTGIGKTAVNRFLNEQGLKPHIVTKRHYSTDVDFEKKLTDVVGLYMNPPANALVLCVDEKTQIQALERAEPIQPMMPHVPERHTTDYFRHGTTTLFAALDVLTGTVIADCSARHTSEDYLRFLQQLDAACPEGKTLHIIADNLATHKTQTVKTYVESLPGRFELHYIPTHSSWLNLVERWFAELTTKRLRRASWLSVDQLIHAIKDYIRTWNLSGRAFKWTKSAAVILAKIDKATSTPYKDMSGTEH